ncbi:SHOCT domain-containing protein [Sphingomonas sp. ABOLE]|uniref:SHOCT domain-containing protein n=1 Tax=Sphingomonas sp. ABOLE TaxID=1985878 RepID=UPI000F7F064D|nr:SHOCT domain-containing protein [Sphingomonas sp. ABOLE]RSV44432.1 SHOCT domain-containing protein [Sphingomonas sp. ABOLE]
MDGVTFLVFAFFGALIFGGASALIGSARGIDGLVCFFLGLFFGPIGLVVAAILPPPAVAQTPTAGPVPEQELPSTEHASPKRDDVPDALSKLADLRDRGALTDEEFASAKASLLKQL